MKAKTNKTGISITAKKYFAEVDLKNLRVKLKQGTTNLIDFYLNGSVRGLGKTKGSILYDTALQYNSHSLHRKKDRYLLSVKMSGKNSLWKNKEIVLCFKEEYFTYFQKVTAGSRKVTIADINYGTALGNEGLAEPSRTSINEAYTLNPWMYRSNIPEKGRADFKLTSRSPAPGGEKLKDEYFQTPGGKVLIPPYAVSLRTGSKWFGIGTLEIPPADAGLHLIINKTQTEILFDYNGSITVPPGQTYRCPEIAFLTAKDKDTVIEKYIDILYETGKGEPSQQQWEDWWSGPIFCFFSDQFFKQFLERKTPTKPEPEMTPNWCTQKFMMERIQAMKKLKIKYRILIIDYGWFHFMGDWDPHPLRFPDLRKIINDLQKQGLKVLLWYNPFYVDTRSKFFREHPGWMIKTPAGKTFIWKRFKTDITFSDVTIEGVRKHIKKNLEFILSDKPGCLNADGIKLDCTHQLYTVKTPVRNPHYGTGELLMKRLMKFVYGEVKKVESAALVNATGGNPMFNSTLDQHRLHDASSMDNNCYDERAFAAVKCRTPYMDTDDWFSFRKFMVRGQLRKIVYGIPAIYALNYRGDMDQTAEYISEENHRLLRSLFNVYLHSPVNPNHKIFIDLERKIFSRTYKTGPLKGFYSALTLSGNQAVASYRDGLIKLSALADTDIVLPLPPESGKEKIFAVGEDGTKTKVKFARVNDDLVFFAKKCSRAIINYEIEFERKNNE
ncbi:MAG: hypothetical protein GXO98_07480 [Nitrospirae bacterium]|nr:hypothetical protein [Nitrospirota bacterium]